MKIKYPQCLSDVTLCFAWNTCTVSIPVESVLPVSISPTILSKLICAFVLSRVDYCNSLLAGCPQNLICKLRKVQNNAARLICRSARFDHISLILRPLHWLPVKSRIQYKIIRLLTFKSLKIEAPYYLSDLIQLYVPSRQLRSSADTQLLSLPSAHLVFWSTCLLLSNTITLEQSTPLSPTIFFYQTPLLWNNLPHSLRQPSSIKHHYCGTIYPTLSDNLLLSNTITVEQSTPLSPTIFFHSSI